MLCVKKNLIRRLRMNNYNIEIFKNIKGYIIDMRDRYGMVFGVDIGGDHSGERHINWIINAFCHSYDKNKHGEYLKDHNPLLVEIAKRLHDNKTPFLGWNNILEHYTWIGSAESRESLLSKIFIVNEVFDNKSHIASTSNRKPKYLCIFSMAHDKEESIPSLKAALTYAQKSNKDISNSITVLYETLEDNWESDFTLADDSTAGDKGLFNKKYLKELKTKYEDIEFGILEILKGFDSDALIDEYDTIAAILGTTIIAEISQDDFYKLNSKIKLLAQIKQFEKQENGKI